MISGVCRGVNDICGLLGFYAAMKGNFVLTFRDNLSVPSLRVVQLKKSSWTTSTLRKIPKERRSQILGVLYAEEKRPGRGADRSPPSSSVVERCHSFLE
jgi:hypothetical protein